MESADFTVYVHLTPTTHPELICETIKITLKRRANEESVEESKEGQRSSKVGDLVREVCDFLTKNRNDGNKVYEVLAISSEFMGVPLPLGLTAGSIFANGSDVYATVRVSVDSKRHVAPISSIPKSSGSLAAPVSSFTP